MAVCGEDSGSRGGWSGYGINLGWKYALNHEVNEAVFDPTVWFVFEPSCWSTSKAGCCLKGS